MKYRLVEKDSDMKNTFIVKIVGDSNDADYVTETMYLDKEDFEKIIPALIDLNNNYSRSHQLEDYPNPMGLEIPYNGWDGYCHTLESLDIEYIDENGKVFDVELCDEDEDEE